MRIRISVCLILIAIACVAGAATDNPYRYGRWTPVAIYADGADSTKLEVWTTGTVSAVELTNGSTTVLGALNDSGIDGDRAAGDGVWTIRGVSHAALGRELIPGMSVTGHQVRITAGGKTTTHDLPGLGLVNKSSIAVTTVTPAVYRTKWGAFLVDKAGEYFDGRMPVCDVRCGKGNEKAFREFYKYFPDSFDFLVIMPFTPIYRPVTFAENVPYYVVVRNAVRNIGMPQENRGAEFGSKAKLKGVIYHSFGYGAILDHEIGHAWGIRIGEAQGFSGSTSIYGSTYGWHIAAYSNQVGQMAAFPHLRLTDNGDGSWKAEQLGDQETDSCYAPLTLYLMGMIPPEQVTPLKILRNPNRGNWNKIPDADFDTITIEEIMDANGGERQPAWPNTQRKFKVGFIFVSDRPMEQSEYDFFSWIPRYFQSKDEGMNYETPFYHATGGRGSVKTRMAKPLKK